MRWPITYTLIMGLSPGSNPFEAGFKLLTAPRFVDIGSEVLRKAPEDRL